jgi:ATP-dependent Clp protease ATP-binding subunit ClpC
VFVFERFSESARRAVFFARFEVSALGGEAITPEHLLLGALRQPRGAIALAIAGASADRSSLVRQLRATCGGDERRPAAVEIPFSKEAKRVLQRAVVEADGFRSDVIGPEHLVLAVFSEPESAGARLLVEAGISAEDLLREIANAEPSGSTPA